MENVSVATNPILQQALGVIRNKQTATEEFKRNADLVNNILLQNVFENGDVSQKRILTPVSSAKIAELSTDFVAISILRSGITMIPAVIKAIPSAKIGFAGIFRDEKTAKPSEYYWKIPKIRKNDTVIICDPMLATGGTILHVIKKLNITNPIRIVCVVAAPEGIGAICKKYPHISITTSSIDEKLNSRKYIVPGLGDYGDRYFGTEDELQ